MAYQRGRDIGMGEGSIYQGLVSRRDVFLRLIRHVLPSITQNPTQTLVECVVESVFVLFRFQT